MACNRKCSCLLFSVLFVIFFSVARSDALSEDGALEYETNPAGSFIVTLDRHKRYMPEMHEQFLSEDEGELGLTQSSNSASGPNLKNKSLEVPVKKPKTGGNYKSVKDVKNVTDTDELNHTPQALNVTTTGTPKLEKNDTISNSTESDESMVDLMVSGNYPEKSVLEEHNITKNLTDHHVFYNSSILASDESVGHQYWIDLNNRNDVNVNEMLSQSHRRAATVQLSFEFPFYGHNVTSVTIATGGFLYMGDYVHSWLAATQYIAPLMANFDTSLSNHSYVKYVDNGTAFTVQWENVRLQDKPNSGDFTFQATLHNNGDIVFVYRSVPIAINTIQNDSHPVKVGLSDAYIIDRTIFFVRRKTIYEYHRVNFEKHSIGNWTVILLKKLPTCQEAKDCKTCTTIPISFECSWCPAAQRCSNGVDRNRQDWLQKNCDKSSVSTYTQCPSPSTELSPHTESTQANRFAAHELTDQDVRIDPVVPQESDSISISSVFGILVIVTFVGLIGLWVLYAYRNPHTSSGQFLIKYRPSQWSWRRGEARYTAATIHM